MNDHPLWLVSFLISTCLSFFSIALAVEIAIGLFRVKNHRFRSMLRLLPILSLGLDVCFSKLSTGNWLNPLYCESCIQKLFLHFAPELKQYLTEHEISWARHLASQAPDMVYIAFLWGFSSISILIFIRQIIAISSSYRSLHALIRDGARSERKIENQGLFQALQKQRAKILVSDAIESPIAAYWKTILIPKNLEQLLSQEEFEAVVSHELEHLRWKDPIFKLFSQIGSTLFWWVPMQWWLKRIDQDQEMAADASVQRYSLEGTALASVLVKMAGMHRRSEPETVCSFTGEKDSSLLARFKIALDPSAIPLQKNRLLRAFIGLAAGSLVTLSCLM